MLSDLTPILIAAAVFIPVTVLAQFFSSRSRSRKLAAMLESLYRGNLLAPQEFHFLDANPEQLYFPFTKEELQRIGKRREDDRFDVSIRLMSARQAFWNNYYFHIVCDFDGLDADYRRFSLQKEGYLYIHCTEVRGHWLPCITHIERRHSPYRF